MNTKGLESPRRARCPVGVLVLAVATLPLVSGVAAGQDVGAAPVSRKEAVQAAATKQAVVAAERRGALHLRDLNVHCGVAEPDLAKLGEALNKAIVEWFEKHPPQLQDWGGVVLKEPDLSAILQSAAWTEAFQKGVSPGAQRAFRELGEARRRRLAAAIAGFVRAFAACELRLTPDQYAALVPLCNEIAEQAVEFDTVYAVPGQLVGARDRGAVRVLSEIQSDYAGPSRSRGQPRDAVTEFELESERLRLVCALDDARAHLLRACGRNQGRKQIAERQAAAASAAAAERKKAEDAKNAERIEDKKKAEVNNGLPREELLQAPFWVKVRDSVLTAEERAKLAAAPPIDAGAVRAARVELALARLESLFHLDAKQLDSLRPLAEKVVDADLESTRVASLDVLRSFGVQQFGYRGDTTPEQRAARRGLEALLDPQQFEVLRDRTGL